MLDHEAAAADRAGAPSQRWRLHRAGIVNVYQYEDEVIRFADGRLLLRGVNGSGKSTAMNMLLPFLLVAHQGRIDAAGEQSGILKSWMLSDREDAQPVGYLWIEFERRGEFLVCGCGIKANRQSDRVTTWWFITSKRPGIDMRFLERGVPMSAERLRAALDGDTVFNERRRRDYRQEVERRLFGGARIRQHIALIDRVRSPRVGDRIDVDLPEHLADALPQLSEQALAEAAQPLDDLEEHRRNVDQLARTLQAVRGLLSVYRSYCVNDLRRRAAEGRARLDEFRRRARDETRRRRAAQEAAAEVQQLDSAISGLSADEERLRGEISALEESQVYRDGQGLDALRDLVANCAERLKQATSSAADRERRVEAAAQQLIRARRRSSGDLKELNEALASAAESGARCRLDQSPPGPVAVAESELADVPGSEASDDVRAVVAHTAAGPGTMPIAGPVDVSAAPPAAQLTAPTPTGAFDGIAVERGIVATGAAVLRRRSDADEMRRAQTGFESAEEQRSRAEAELEMADNAARGASARLEDSKRRLRAATREWAEQTSAWAAETHPLLHSAGVYAPAAAALALTGTAADADPAAAALALTGTGESATGADAYESVRTLLLAESDELAGRRRDAITVVDRRLETEQETAEEARALVEELAARSEPDPPRHDWQAASGYCLADLIDFSSSLSSSECAGLEAAMQASGLLSARVTDDSSVELANGELLAIATDVVPNPLSGYLSVTVPDRLAGEIDGGLVAKLLDSISSDTSGPAVPAAADAASTAADTVTPAVGATAAVAADGTFRVGSLQGRHSKERAEFIGVTARRAALERDRRQAAESLDQALSVVSRSEAELEDCKAAYEEARHFQRTLPSTAPIVSASADVNAESRSAAAAEDARIEAEKRFSEGERVSSAAWDDLQRTATTLALPVERHALDEIRRELGELTSLLDRCRSSLVAVRRSVDDWNDAADRWRQTVDDLNASRESQERIRAEHGREHARFITVQDSIGVEYAEVIATRERCKLELEETSTRLSATREARDRAVSMRARCKAAVGIATEHRESAESGCETMRRSLAEALDTPGFVGAAVARDADASAITARTAGPEGLREILEAVGRLLASAPSAAGVPLDEAGVTNADSVRLSLRQRRDALGAGWDAEARQPDPLMPLLVEVNGPWGKLPLADSVVQVEQQHRQLAGLLDSKQDNALRELLQGQIAREVAEKIHSAKRLVELMNERLGVVTTAHSVGVQLRWRRSPELEPTAKRMVQLMEKRPDLRTEDQETELRHLLAHCIYEERQMHPDTPYRQLIADTLDYKNWHEMSVMLRRQDGRLTRLTRRTPLSEGEKKLVTYLPLFAAVAASYDALAEQNATPDGERPGVARFVLLDDAFAKVSEDNHEALFGLLVELDLDLIATSERLWGTHPNVPELSIVEVVRDAALGAILLEHYRWDGAACRLETLRGTR